MEVLRGNARVSKRFWGPASPCLSQVVEAAVWLPSQIRQDGPVLMQGCFGGLLAPGEAPKLDHNH